MLFNLKCTSLKQIVHLFNNYFVFPVIWKMQNSLRKKEDCVDYLLNGKINVLTKIGYTFSIKKWKIVPIRGNSQKTLTPKALN